jgi:hypothetical protein
VIEQERVREPLGPFVDIDLLDQIAHIDGAHFGDDVTGGLGHAKRAIAGADKHDRPALLDPFFVFLRRRRVHMGSAQRVGEAVGVVIKPHDPG